MKTVRIMVQAFMPFNLKQLRSVFQKVPLMRTARWGTPTIIVQDLTVRWRVQMCAKTAEMLTCHPKIFLFVHGLLFHLQEITLMCWANSCHNCLTCCRNCWSSRDWLRQLGVSYVIELVNLKIIVEWTFSESQELSNVTDVPDQVVSLLSVNKFRRH